MSIHHIIRSLDKQLYLSDVIGNHDWHFDIASGMVIFSTSQSWHVQLLSKESKASGTWAWAWANIASNIPDHLLHSSRTLRAYGEQHSIPEVTTPQLPLDHVDGHTLALFASGICEANAYYRCPYEGGALYVLIMDENFPKCQDPPIQRIATVFPQAIASLDIPDHRLAFTGYLDSYKLGYEQDGDKLVVKENGKVKLTATFDEQNWLTNLEVKLNAKTDSLGESWDEGQLRRMLGG